MKKAVLLINVGTPDSPTIPGIARFLREFLMDPGLIRLPFIPRWLLVNFLIVPFRSMKVVKNELIWQKEGSPLLVHSNRFAQKVQDHLGDEIKVYLSMRYGNPSIPAVLKQMYSEGCKSILIAPLFPQYAEATTGSAINCVNKALAKLNWNPKIKVLPAFFSDSRYISSLAQSLKAKMAKETNRKFIFSFHGLPVSHLAGCCENVASCQMQCYRAHCFKTSELLGLELGLSKSQYSVGFQSRFGRAKWIGPTTDNLLAQQPCLAPPLVLCPGFVVDCLETLEEIASDKRFSLEYISCLNDADYWVASFSQMLREHL